MIIIDSLEEWRKRCNIIRFVLVARDDVDYSTLEEQAHSLLKILVRSSRFVERFIIIIRANSIVYFVEYIVIRMRCCHRLLDRVGPYIFFL